MKKVIPSVEVVTCDVCGKEIKDRPPKMKIRASERIFERFTTWGFSYVNLDLCGECAERMIEFIKKER